MLTLFYLFFGCSFVCAFFARSRATPTLHFFPLLLLPFPQVRASLIVVLTRGGSTPRLVAKYRPAVPILTVAVPVLITDVRPLTRLVFGSSALCGREGDPNRGGARAHYRRAHARSL